MSHFGGFVFGGQFFEFEGDGVFFHGTFFAGGFFDELVLFTSGGKGDNSQKKRKSIYKPTGLPPYRETVERRVQETHEIAKEVAREARAVLHLPKPVERMSLAELDAEIGVLLHKKLRTEDEEIVLMLLVAVAG